MTPLYIQWVIVVSNQKEESIALRLAKIIGANDQQKVQIFQKIFSGINQCKTVWIQTRILIWVQTVCQKLTEDDKSRR